MSTKMVLRVAKKLCIAFVLCLIIFPAISLAQGSNYIAPLNQGNTAAPQNLTTKSGVETLIKAVVRWVYTIFFVVAVLFILLAAYNFLTGGGNDAKLKLAKAQIRYAVIAIIVALLSTGAAAIVNSAFSSSS